MPIDPNIPGTYPPQPNLPPSRPLQIFLLVALLISGAAYVVNEWTKLRTEEATTTRPSKLRRLVAAQSQFLTETSLGRQAEARKKYDEAVLHYSRALSVQDSAEARLDLGNVLLKQDNPDMAFSQFKEAIRLKPSLEDVYVAWGQALKLQGKTDEAVQLYQDALRHNSNFAQVHYNFAIALEQQQQAAQATQRAADFANQSQPAAKAAAEAQLFGSDAARHYAEAERLGLNTPGFWCSYGTLLNKQGKPAQAEA